MIHARGCGEQGRASERTWLWAAPVRHLVRSLWALVQLPWCVEGGHVLAAWALAQEDPGFGSRQDRAQPAWEGAGNEAAEGTQIQELG